MSAEYKNFGDFLNQKRRAKGVSYRELATILGVTAPYISDIEKNRRHAPAKDKLDKIADYFVLSQEERSIMYDLAGETKSELPPDIPNYVMQHSYVAAALRTARDLDATEEEWQAFVDDLKKRKG